MVERAHLISYAGGPLYNEKYYVKVDEDYRIQYGDSTVEVLGESNLIFDDVRVEGYSFWVLRHSQDKIELKGYVFDKDEWVPVRPAT